MKRLKQFKIVPSADSSSDDIQDVDHSKKPPPLPPIRQLHWTSGQDMKPRKPSFAESSEGELSVVASDTPRRSISSVVLERHTKEMDLLFRTKKHEEKMTIKALLRKNHPVSYDSFCRILQREIDKMKEEDETERHWLLDNEEERYLLFASISAEGISDIRNDGRTLESYIVYDSKVEREKQKQKEEEERKKEEEEEKKKKAPPPVRVTKKPKGPPDADQRKHITPQDLNLMRFGPVMCSQGRPKLGPEMPHELIIKGMKPLLQQPQTRKYLTSMPKQPCPKVRASKKEKSGSLLMNSPYRNRMTLVPKRVVLKDLNLGFHPAEDPTPHYLARGARRTMGPYYQYP